MTKQDWEKEMSESLKSMGLGMSGSQAEWIFSFIRQTREQARQEGIEEAIEAIRIEELMDMSCCRSRLTGSTAYQIPTNEKTLGYNEAVFDQEAKIAKLKKNFNLIK